MNFFITKSGTQDLFGFKPITLNECVAALNKETLISIDVETTGLNFLDDTLLMLQISTVEDNYVIDCQTVDILPLKGILVSREIVKMGHNLSFDLKFLKHAKLDAEAVYCTFLTDKVINCGKVLRYALKSLLERYLGLEMSKAVRNTFIGHKGDFTQEQVLYGIDDTRHLFAIKMKQNSLLIKYNLETVARLENEVLLAFVDMEYNGVALDKSAWADLAKIARIHCDTLLDGMDLELIRSNPEYKNNQLDLFGGGRDAIIKWTSPLQVLGLFKKYNNKLESVGADILAEHQETIPLIKPYIRYKAQSKLANAYGLDFFQHIRSDNRIHTRFNQVLNTGRVSSSTPNMQQIPSNDAYRNAFIPGEDDYVFVSSDFGAQELCIIAVGSKDPVWLEVLRAGGDLHSTCAELIFGAKWFNTKPGSPERKVLRTHVKTINFALAYGAGAFSISKSLGITESEARRLIKDYYRAFPRIEKFLKALGNFGKDNGFIKTFPPFRRTRFFPEWKGKATPKKEMAKIIRASKNTCIQGAAADQTKTALILVRREIKEHNLPVKIVLAIHDEINTICHKDYAEEWGVQLKELMERSAEVNMGERIISSDTTISSRWQK